MKKRITFLMILTLCTSCIWACGNGENEAEIEAITQTEIETNIETTEEIITNTTEEYIAIATEESETENEPLYFDTDEAINHFFENYNIISDIAISKVDIEKGNIDEKALVYIDDFSMEVVNSKQGFLAVSISTSPENEETKLYNVFTNCIKSTNKDLSNEEIETAWKEIHETGYMVEGYDLKGINITYIPYKELSKGHSDLRIDLNIPME